MTLRGAILLASLSAFLCFSNSARAVSDDFDKIIGVLDALCLRDDISKSKKSSFHISSNAEGNIIVRIGVEIIAALGLSYESDDSEGFSAVMAPDEFSKVVLAGMQCRQDNFANIAELYALNFAKNARAVVIDTKCYKECEISGTNADTISDILDKQLRNRGISREDIHTITPRPIVGWDSKTVHLLDPELIFMHWSAFELEGENCSRIVLLSDNNETNPCIERTINYIKTIANNTRSDFLIFTRTPRFCLHAPRLMLDAVSEKILDKSILDRVAFIEMARRDQPSSIPGKRNGDFNSERAKSDIVEIAGQVFDGKSIKFAVRKFSEGRFGVCSARG